MAQNPGIDPQIPLNTFAGLVTNIDPVALPAGASPDCVDMQFLPGGAFSRPGFKKVFSTHFGNATVTYAKSYVDPKGVIRNLYLDSLGNLWVENLTTNPGAFNLLATTTPGSYVKSITAFGREYIAISDKLHGADVPLQLAYDSDGNAQLDRVTQDGPGGSPSIASLSLPAVDVAASGSPLTLAIAEIDPQNADPISGFFTSINLYTTSSVTTLQVGQTVTIAGTGNYDGTFGPITAIFPGVPRSLVQITAYIPAGTNCEAITPPGICTLLAPGATATVSQGSLQRQSNVVTGKTTVPHQLQPGYQVQITNALALPIGTGITSIVISNEDLPGVATVTVGLAAGQISHGLVPGLNVSMSGIKAVAVGTAIVSLTRSGQVVTVKMAAGTNLNPGAIITISGVPTASFNTTTQVINVTTTTNPGDTFTYGQADVDAVDSSGTGTIAVNWPVPDAPAPTFYQVIAAPTATTFQVAVFYSDGTWTSGSVAYPWNGTFFVATVPDPQTFTYQQYGPDGTASPVSGAIVATPYGQASPGEHQMTVFFIDRQGGATAYAPPVKFIANGGQYLSVTNIPIGPPNIAARAIAFTGAAGAYFFYIPAPPQVNGQLVGTATQINDNTTTAAIFDFGDPTLYAALGISTQGNNLANQVVIDGALGFGYYSSRLFTWGQRNRVGNFLNLGFDGGYFPNLITIPTGWNPEVNSGGALAGGHYGGGWGIAVTPTANRGQLSQSAYEDYTGAPILTGNTQYKVRLWITATAAQPDVTFTVYMSSLSLTFSISAVFNGANMTNTGSYLEATFTGKTPMVIPSDMLLQIFANSGTSTVNLIVDEISIIYEESPYLKNMIASYANNPEGFDGVSGVIGPVNDTHPVLAMGIIRDNLYMLTQDPSGRLHETAQGITEPADWTVNEVAANCGAVSAFCLTQSQADDSSAAGGEEWFAWYSSTGYRIFGGEAPDKISQEIQRPVGQTFPGAPPDLGAINNSALLSVWSINDPDAKVIYLGIPSGTATAPDRIFYLSYLGLDSASAIVANPPVHKALGGKLIAMDLGRKWAPWNRPMNGAALMFRELGSLTPVFFGGNGTAPGAGGFGNVYTLNSQLLTDDDYGLIEPYYVTYGFPDRDAEQQMQLGGGLKMLTYLQSFFFGVGTMDWSILYNSLANIWRLKGSYPMSTSPLRNAEWAGGQCTAQRFFFKFASVPNPQGTTATPATDNSFGLSVLVVGMKKNARMPVAGRYP